jgi:hypothetical protein
MTEVWIVCKNLTVLGNSWQTIPTGLGAFTSEELAKAETERCNRVTPGGGYYAQHLDFHSK